jgi:predicted aspartyl protease
VTLPMYEATILWNGKEREIRVLATGRRPLLGTAMLENHELTVQFVENGLVTIDEI